MDTPQTKTICEYHRRTGLTRSDEKQRAGRFVRPGDLTQTYTAVAIGLPADAYHAVDTVEGLSRDLRKTCSLFVAASLHDLSTKGEPVGSSKGTRRHDLESRRSAKEVVAICKVKTWTPQAAPCFQSPRIDCGIVGFPCRSSTPRPS